jgi:hypothetical protein
VLDQVVVEGGGPSFLRPDDEKIGHCSVHEDNPFPYDGS